MRGSALRVDFGFFVSGNCWFDSKSGIICPTSEHRGVPEQSKNAKDSMKNPPDGAGFRQFRTGSGRTSQALATVGLMGDRARCSGLKRYLSPF